MAEIVSKKIILYTSVDADTEEGGAESSGQAVVKAKLVQFNSIIRFLVTSF